jgi:hypothetical protein
VPSARGGPLPERLAQDAIVKEYGFCAKPPPNIFQCFCAALILSRVMQKCVDCLIFDDQSRHGQPNV